MQGLFHRLHNVSGMFEITGFLRKMLISPLPSNPQASTFSKKSGRPLPKPTAMGYRFQGGTPVEFVEREQPFSAGSGPSNITDAPYPYGSIQVPGGTEPIILHRDTVSDGGFFTLGAVISAYMGLIEQLQPHTEIRFVEVDMQIALDACHECAKIIEDIRAFLI